MVEELGQLIFIAELADDPRTEGNVEALEAVQPEDLVAEEINVTLGMPWIPASSRSPPTSRS